MIHIPDTAFQTSFSRIHDDPSLRWKRAYSYSYKDIILTLVEYNCKEYSEITAINGHPLVPCPVCFCSPQLRYNKINKKYSCVCPSSSIPDDDKEELSQIFSWFNNPIEAVCNWNISSSKEILSYNENLLKELN